MPRGIYERTKKLNKITIDKENPEIAYIHVNSPKYGKFEILIDTEDIDLVKDYTWSIAKPRNIFYCWTSVCNGKQRGIKLHRLILDFPELDIDHISGDGLDNRKCNLRTVTNQQNSMNKISQKNSSSRYKGVSWNSKCNKWRATIRIDGKLKCLGLFELEEAAGYRYDKFAKELFGEFARLNFPD